MSKRYFVIGADIVPTASNSALFATGDAEQLVGLELLAVLRESDYRIFNLEVPLTDRKEPISKQGPNLIASTKCIHGYQALGTDLLTLANNHIMDQGIQGLKSTVDMLDRVGIAHVGTGGNVVAAAQPHFFSFAGKRVGVYACAEHEFSIATPDSPGANPFDPLWSLDHIAAMHEKCEYVIVLYHGGKEHYRYPSPSLQKTCRRLVDKGADLVVCQHSHCVGCEERYKGSTIVYGQGNFLFDDCDNEFWQTGLLLSVEENFEVKYICLKKNGNSVRLADDGEAEKILAGFNERSREIEKHGFIEERYKVFAASFIEYYLNALYGKKSLAYRALNRLTGGKLASYMLTQHYGEAECIRLMNYLDCEAHRELLSSGLKVRGR